jgi:hypothetical protein
VQVPLPAADLLIHIVMPIGQLDFALLTWLHRRRKNWRLVAESA